MGPDRYIGLGAGDSYILVWGRLESTHCALLGDWAEAEIIFVLNLIRYKTYKELLLYIANNLKLRAYFQYGYFVPRANYRYRMILQQFW